MFENRGLSVPQKVKPVVAKLMSQQSGRPRLSSRMWLPSLGLPTTVQLGPGDTEVNNNFLPSWSLWSSDGRETGDNQIKQVNVVCKRGMKGKKQAKGRCMREG